MDSFNVMFSQQSAYLLRCEVLVWKQGNSHRLFRGPGLVPVTLSILTVSTSIAIVFKGLL